MGILDPKFRQPGDGIVTSVIVGTQGGKHEEIHGVISKLSEEAQKEISRKLTHARRKNKITSAYHEGMTDPIVETETKKLHLEILNVLLDFEVARRLQFLSDDEKEVLKPVNVDEDNRHNRLFMMHANMKQRLLKLEVGLTPGSVGYQTSDREKWDSIPVASAVCGLLSMQQPLAIFFLANESLTIGGESFPYGEYNAFQGGTPKNKNYREDAVKNILRAKKLKKNSTSEEVHAEYLKYFGGASESEDEAASAGPVAPSFLKQMKADATRDEEPAPVLPAVGVADHKKKGGVADLGTNAPPAQNSGE